MPDKLRVKCHSFSYEIFDVQRPQHEHSCIIYYLSFVAVSASLADAVPVQLLSFLY